MKKIFFTDLECFSNSIVFTTQSEQITYNKLVEEINTLSLFLKGRDLVFLLCENSIESIVGYLACLRSGAVPLLIGATIDETLLLNLIERYKPSYVWTNRSFSWLEESWKNVHENRSYHLYDKLLKHEHSFHQDLAILLMTSGSTGSPILVRLSYENLNQNAISISASLSITNNDVPITSLPMNYTYGLSILNSHLLNGCQIVLTESSVLSKEFWELLKNKQVTTFGGVPYTYQMLKKLGFDKMNLHNVSKLTQAGGKLDLNLIKYFAEQCINKDIQFYVMYGQTEATARMSCLSADYSLIKAGSIGKPILNGEFFLVDDANKIITEAEVEGELYYRGPNVSMGYAHILSDFIKEDENKGVIATGDIAKRDVDGFYYIVGRKKRFIKIFGNRISLDEVENIFHKNDISAICTGIDDKLVIYTTQEEKLIEIKQFISSKIGIHHSAIAVVFISEFPRNDSGKILYSKL